MPVSTLGRNTLGHDCNDDNSVGSRVGTAPGESGGSMPRHWSRSVSLAVLSALVLQVVGGLVGPTAPSQAQSAAPAITGLHVVGNQLLNAAGQPVRLLGVNRSSAEYACVQGWGIFDGPTDQASVTAMLAWK